VVIIRLAAEGVVNHFEGRSESCCWHVDFCASYSAKSFFVLFFTVL
jgi:hypothetical protein